MTSPRIQVRKATMAWGDKGARWTIAEVARLVKKYMGDPWVRAWVVQKIAEAKAKGKDVDDQLSRAQAILSAVQNEFVYVNDPLGTEMIVGPAWLIQRIIPGGDCDCLTLLTAVCLLLALASAGIRCAILGHSYTPNQEIDHILCAIYLAPDPRKPKNKKWFYADACTKQPLGAPVAPPTWELAYDPMEPDRPFCDAEACLMRHDNKPPQIMWAEAEFVGVAGPPVVQSLTPDSPEIIMDNILIDPAPQAEEGLFGNTEEIASALLALSGVQESPAPKPAAPRVAFSAPALPKLAHSPAGTQAGTAAPPPQPRTPARPWAAPAKPAWRAPAPPRRVAHDVLAHEHGASVKAAKSTDSFALSKAFQDEAPPTQTDKEIQEAWPAWQQWLTSLRDAVQFDLYDLNDRYEKFRAFCNDLGIPFPPQIPGAVWDLAQDKLFQQVVQFATDAIKFLQDAIDGKRNLIRVAPPAQLVLPDNQQEQDLAIGSLPTDTIRYTLAAAQNVSLPIPQPISASAPPPAPDLGGGFFVSGRESGLAGVGLFPFLLPAVSGAAVALTVGMIFNGRELIAFLKESIEHYTSVLLMREMGNLAAKGWTPEQVQAALGKVNQGMVDRKKAEIDRLEEERKIIIAEKDKAVAMLDRAMWIGGTILAVGLGVWVWKNFGKDWKAKRDEAARSAPREAAPSYDESPETIPPSPSSQRRRTASVDQDIYGAETEPVRRGGGPQTRPVASESQRMRHNLQDMDEPTRRGAPSSSSAVTQRTAPSFETSDGPPTAIPSTMMSPVYQGNPWGQRQRNPLGQRQGNPALDAYTLADQLKKHVEWGEIEEAAMLAQKGIEDMFYKDRADQIDALLYDLSTHPMLPEPVVAAVLTETQRFTTGYKLHLHYLPRFIQLARSMGYAAAG